jgi:filamentous hemagglutinin family protein
MKGRGSLNHLYRLVWSQVLGAWIAVAETTKGRGKGASRKLLVAAAGLFSALAQAAPEGGQVVSGTGSIAQSGATTTITQTTQSLSLNWDSFNIAAQETVNFHQPSATAIAVNRIMDSNGTQILGNLNANGQVYLINPNGILFGQGAQVNVGALVASTLDLNDASLNSDSRSFSGNGAGSVINHGTINAADGGYVALLGNTVSNQGTITAPLGTVALGAGSAATLTFADNSLVQMQVDQSLLNNLADNGGLIQADGGRVLMSAGAKDALLASVVNNTGVIEARSVENRDGVIVLLGGMQAGTVQVAGTLDASAPHGGDGGFIETSAAHVKVADNAKITTAAAHGKTGTWLIDPTDYTIAATDPGNGSSYMSNAALSTSLNTNNVTIQTLAAGSGNGDIHVNDAVSWSANNTLTLDAHRNINIKQSITATGDSGKLALKYGQGSTSGVIGGVAATYNVNAPVNLKAGGNFSTQLGSTGSVKSYTVITSLGVQGSTTATDLQGINGGLAGNYVLGSNIDASATSGWNEGSGFAPIKHELTIPDTSSFCITSGYCWDQTQTTPFTGTFDGLGHSISALTINRPATEYVGLFGQTSTTAQIRNIGLVGGSVIGQARVGALVGDNSGAISNSYATGSVSGNNYVGGLVGFNDLGAIASSYATGSVTGTSQSVGGLVGESSGTVNESYATGSVTGTSQSVGGLAGVSSGTVSNSYASGPVQGSNWSGGLLGLNTGTLSNSYATGRVSGTSLVGGLVGNNRGAVSASYATGDVNGTLYVGGLLGNNNNLVSYSYATGRVAGTNAGTNGGLVGVNDGDVTYSYWNKESTVNGIGRGSLTGSTGLTSIEMQTAANFAGFNFTTTPGAAGNNWVMVDVDGSLNNAGGAAGSTRPMLASEYSTTINNAHQLQLMAMDLSASYTLGANVDATTTGLSTDVWGSEGFVPVGNTTTLFTGSLGGLGHSISNLTIVRENSDFVGLFGRIETTAVIRNVGLVGGSISGNYYVGGLVGYNNGGSVSSSYTTGSVSGIEIVGGLMGYHDGGSVSSSYATGRVEGQQFVGGLVGYNMSGSVSTSYATGSVSGLRYVGGLVGFGTVSSSFWNKDVITDGIGSGNTSGATGLTSSQMMQMDSFSNWNTATPNSIANTGGSGAVWRIYEGHTAPLLTSFMTGLALDDITVTYNGNAQYGTSTSGVLGAAATGTNVGVFYNDYYSTQQGYDISGGNLSINAAALSLKGTRVYDGTANVAASIFSLSGLVNGENLTLRGVGTLADKNVGVDKTVILGSLALGNGTNGLASNYTFDGGTQKATITKADLSVTGISASNKTYDANTTATLLGTATVAALLGDNVSVGGTGIGAFGNASVGTGKTVSVSGYSLSGTDASNYLVVQPVGITANITAAPKIPTPTPTPTSERTLIPVSVVNVTAQLSASVLSPQISSQPQALNLSPSVRVSQSANADSGAANDSSAADANNGAAVNAQMTIGSAGPSLLIVSGGVRLPGNTDAEK